MLLVIFFIMFCCALVFSCYSVLKLQSELFQEFHLLNNEVASKFIIQQVDFEPIEFYDFSDFN